MEKRGGVQSYFGITAITVILLAALIGVAIKSNAFKGFLSGLPDFRESDAYKGLAGNQNQVAIEEKTTGPSGKIYSVGAISYSSGNPDLFVFRWNPSVNKVQSLIMINDWIVPDEWVIDPRLNDKFAMGEGIFIEEKDFVTSIMNALSEGEMNSRISQTLSDYNEAKAFNLAPSALRKGVELE